MDLGEQITFLTCQIIATLPNGYSRGTGYLYMFKDDELQVPVLVTNKHVVHDAVKTEFLLPYYHENEPGKRFSRKLVQANGEKDWMMHAEAEVDLCVLPLAGEIVQLQKEDPDARPMMLDESIVATQDYLEKLGPIEDVIMVGYPIGLIDAAHNAPLVRKGITASHPKYDYNNKPEFLIDCACFPGSSGSPVFLYETGAFVEGNTVNLGQSRVMFLGTMYAGPTYNADGEIVVVDIPTAQAPMMVPQIPTNLGYVIKASKLLEFKQLLMMTAHVVKAFEGARQEANNQKGASITKGGPSDEL